MPSTGQHGSTRKPQGERAASSSRSQETSATVHSAPDPVRALQQTLGNQGMLRRMETGLRINDVNDPGEREADRVADRVMSATTFSTRRAFSFSIRNVFGNPAKMRFVCGRR